MEGTMFNGNNNEFRHSCKKLPPFIFFLEKTLAGDEKPPFQGRQDSDNGRLDDGCKAKAWTLIMSP
jgi:hypothetical protein